MSDARLTEVEIALSHAEAALEELSGVVRAQSDRIDRLDRLVDAMARRIAEAEAGVLPPADERPPHW